MISGSMSMSQSQSKQQRAPVARRSLCWRVLKTVAAQCACQLQASSPRTADDSYRFSLFCFCCCCWFWFSLPSHGLIQADSRSTRQCFIHSQTYSFRARFEVHLVVMGLTPSPARLANWFHIHWPSQPHCRRLLQLLAASQTPFCLIY